MRFRVPILRLTLVALALVLVGRSSAMAGWVTIKNETKTALVITDNGKGKPVTIQPGETYREFQTMAGNKTISVATSQRPNNPVTTGKLTWGTDDIKYSLRSDGVNYRINQDSFPKK